MGKDLFQLYRRLAVFLLLPVHVTPFGNAARVDAEYFVSYHDGYCPLQSGLHLVETLSIIRLAQTLPLCRC